MTTYPVLGPRKKIEELRSCKGCNLTVMARGDYFGWKGIDVGGGQMHWFCDKVPCRQLRDETIARRSGEMLAEQVRQHALAAQNTELEALRAKVAELERAKAEAPLPDNDPEVTVIEGAAPIATHIVNAAGTGSLCGSTGPVVKQVELTWDHNPCSVCTAKWQSIAAGTDKDMSVAPASNQAGTRVQSSDGKGSYLVTRTQDGQWNCECEGFKYGRACRHIAEVSAKPVSMQPVAPTVDSVASALYGERSQAKSLDALQRFTPELITDAAARPDHYVGQTILVPPTAYPHIDMASIQPESLRGGITALFRESGLVVDRIEQAKKESRVVGIVFSLSLPHKVGGKIPL